MSNCLWMSKLKQAVSYGILSPLQFIVAVTAVKPVRFLHDERTVGRNVMNGNNKSRRHELVPGFNNLCNDVIVCGDISRAQNHVIFFGGDVQDYPEKMEVHRDNKRYVDRNLEWTASNLSNKFPNSAVFVIKPCKMHLNTFSVFSNFVESNAFGCPNHIPSIASWQHLQALHANIVAKELDSLDVPQDSCPKDTSSLTGVALTLMGFSKGCIVLNQLLYGLALAQREESLKTFIDGVKEFYWLDGGHSGGGNTWVTDVNVLSDLAKLKTKITVHVTPYQVQDPMRVWIGKEERKFVSKLRKMGADITETLHFEDLPGSIENHFRVLDVL